MAGTFVLSLALTSLLVGLVSARDWDILSQFKREKDDEKITLQASNLKAYCESWRINVELHNIRGFQVVRQECISHVKKYMTSSQYDADVERAIDEVILYLSNSCCNMKQCDGKDVWIFDIDDTLLSSIPYYKKHGFGGETLNVTSFEEWLQKSKAPAIRHVLRLYHEIRQRGIKILLVSSRKEYLRSATVDNLIQEGYHGWSNLILRGFGDEHKEVKQYKAEVRNMLESAGYRIWGVMGDQWNNFEGCPGPKRSFKLPNSIYYVS